MYREKKQMEGKSAINDIWKPYSSLENTGDFIECLHVM